MVVQTRAKTEINNFEENDASKEASLPPKLCSDCGGSTDAKHIVKTFVVVTEDGVEIPKVTCKELCGSCLVGHDVAVFRGAGDWCFGEVKFYDCTKADKPYLMTFLDGDEEWCHISATHTADYLSFIGMNDLPNNEDTVPSFSSSSFSEMSSSSFCFSGVKPLYDESKLILLDRGSNSSWSILEEFDHDESIYSDEEGNIEIVSKPFKKKQQPTKTTKTNQCKSSTKKNQRKPRVPVMWTKEEDENLTKVVDRFNNDGRLIKWQDIADDMETDRNGKQCRERYINHLSPTLKGDVWSPKEDHSLFSAFFRVGKKWSIVSKVLRGRTDNGTKNRFHHLRRRLIKDLRRKGEQYPDLVCKETESIGGDSEDAIEMSARKILHILAVESKGNKESYSLIKGYKFGPFMAVKDQAKLQCKRCGLFVPSEQTGSAVCTRTKWCEACTQVPPYVSPDLLRECLELRQEYDGPVEV